MLKFVKRINEDHQRSKSLNPPILGKELVFFLRENNYDLWIFFRENTTDLKKTYIYLFFSSLFSRRGTFWYFGRH